MAAQSIGLETSTRHYSWQVGADGQRCEQGADGPDDIEHHIDTDIAEHLELFVGFAAVQEETVQHAQQRCVAGVKEIGNARCERIGDQVYRASISGLAHKGRSDRPRRLKVRVLLLEGQVLIVDLEELAIMRLAPVTPGPFPLFNDGFYRSRRRGQVGDRNEFRPCKVLLCRLGPGWSDEDLWLALFLEPGAGSHAQCPGRDDQQWQTPLVRAQGSGW